MSRPHLRTRTGTTPIPTEDRRASAPAGEVPQLLRLLHLASPALPIGAFHFSQALEYAVDTGWIREESSALEWIEGIAHGSLATLDLPVLYRLHRAWLLDDHDSLRRWNAFLIACRETAELRLEDRHLGSSLLRVLAELEVTTAVFRAGIAQDSGGVAHATAFALACARWNITSGDMLRTYAWTWAENQVLAAVKLVPLGQSAGQRMLHALHDRLDALGSRAAALQDSDIGITSCMQAIASGRHETQYTRLFRS